jgi:YVTN family beta-propeller protein
MGNKVLANLVGNVAATAVGTVVTDVPSPVTPAAAPIAFDYARTSVFTANTSNDSVTQLLLNSSTAGFSANTTTISLEPGSAPIGVSFQYFGNTYTQDYVVNSNTGATTATRTCPLGTGSLATITQPAAQLKATTCVGHTPVSAWIYKDQSKVFVLDSNGLVYVVSASKYQVTNTIAVGPAPIKAAQSNNGQYIYVLNSGDGSISIIDGQTESVVGTVNPTTNPLCTAICASPLIDIAQDTNFNDTTANTQINHVWLLHANGTVSVFDGTAPGELTWITSLSTTSTVLPTAAPTNLALMRDGTQAYVGVSGTDQIIGIDTSKLATGAITPNATTAITVGVHRSIPETGLTCNATTGAGCLEVTTPMVNYVAVSRGGNSADLSKAYATTTTTTTYYYYDANGNPTSGAPNLVPGCTVAGANSISCPNLYNGIASVTAAANGATPVNTLVTTVPAPAQVTYCTPPTGEFDGQKNCPAQIPVMVLGRS